MTGRSRRPALLAVAGSALVLAAATAAQAHWVATGSGSGSAASGTTVALSLSPGTAAAGLRPGGTSEVVLTASNPNPHDVRLGSLSLDPGQGTGGFAVDGAHSGCATTALGFAPQTNGGAGWTVPARVGAVDGTLAISLPGAVSMALDAANACQGATFTVYLAAGP